MGGIYSRVREIRNTRRLTQAQVAKRMGVSVAAVKNYEHNRHLPRAAKLQELAAALDCSVAALTAPQGSPIPAPRRRRKLLGRKAVSSAVAFVSLHGSLCWHGPLTTYNFDHLLALVLNTLNA